MANNDRHQQDEQRWSAMMAASQRGDQTSYSALLAELGDVIEVYLRVRFGYLDTLEDCVQECLMAIHQARHTYDPGRAFRPWMFTVVRHRTIDVLRRRQHWQNCREQLQASSIEEGDNEQWLQRLDGARILEALAPDHREVVVLAKYAGYTTAEAADWLGISESAVKSRLRRALKTILKTLEHDDD